MSDSLTFAHVEAHDFRSGTFDHLIDQRDDFEHILEELTPERPLAPSTAERFHRTITFLVGRHVRHREVEIVASRHIGRL